MAAESPLLLYTKLRKTVATDVKAARRAFASVLSEPGEQLDAVLELASQPGEGRVRQMIATAARLERFVDRIEPWLQRWLLVESDEFARSAITAALLSNAAPTEVVPEQPAEEMPLGFVDTYRFVADRLCHRVQQAMPIPSAMLVRLEKLARKTTDDDSRVELNEILTRLRTAFHRLSQTLEFDTGDGYVEWQSISLGDWLESAKTGFATKFGMAKLTIIGTSQARRASIRANQFLLETTFGNLWSNAVQATEHLHPDECHITAELNLRENALDILLRDNGPGFAATMVESAFQLQYSTKAETRGRGLLEIADAIRRLHGKVKLVPVGAAEFRVLISFDWKQP